MTSLIPGAIRWDAFYEYVPGGASGNISAEAAQDVIGFSAYRHSAPWFVQSVSPNVIRGNATQANIDTEIAVAKQAGLKYWAYPWYQPFATRDYMAAWRFHQVSAHKADMNWCLITDLGTFNGALFSATSSWQAQMAAWVVYFQQSNYQKVLTNRPLVYITFTDADVTTWFGGSLANVATMLSYLNGLCSSASLGNVYFVLCGASATVSARLTTIGSAASAISAYDVGNSGSGAYSVLDTQSQAAWATYLATGSKMIPTCMSGWSPLARRERPVPQEVSFQRPFQGYNQVFASPTPSQLATHLQAAITFVEGNASACESGAILIYAWTECDESGYPLVPTLSDPPVNAESGQSNLTSFCLSGIGPTLRAVA